MAKVEIYGGVGSTPTRVVILVAKAIGVSFELKPLDPAKKSQEFKKFNPQQQIPVLVDNGFVLNESRAIIKYLVDKYAKDDSLYPKDIKARAIVNARLDFDCGTLMPRIAATYENAQRKVSIIKSVNDALGVVEEFLTRDKWIAGPKLTIADINLSTIIGLVSEFGCDLTPYPKILQWLEECSKNIPNYSLNEEGLANMREYIAKFQEMMKAK